MRPSLSFAMLLVGCGSSSTGGAVPDGLADYVGQQCVVRIRPDVLGAVRDNPVDVDYGMQRSVAVAATGTLKGVDPRWITVVRKDGSTILIARDTVVTVDFGPKP